MPTRKQLKAYNNISRSNQQFRVLRKTLDYFSLVGKETADKVVFTIPQVQKGQLMVEDQFNQDLTVIIK